MPHAAEKPARFLLYRREPECRMTGSQQDGCQGLARICCERLGIDRDLESRAPLYASLEAKFPGPHGDIVADSDSSGYM